MKWPTNVRRSLTTIKVVAVLVLLEQGSEVLFHGISLAEHPVIVIVALGALGFPFPSRPDE